LAVVKISFSFELNLMLIYISVITGKLGLINVVSLLILRPFQTSTIRCPVSYNGYSQCTVEELRSMYLGMGKLLKMNYGLAEHLFKAAELIEAARLTKCE